MKCAKKMFNCPPLKSSILLEDKSFEAKININDKNVSLIAAYNLADSNERVARINIQTNNLIFHQNTAEKKRLIE